ncbi:hypothetical protein [Streptomyces sp. NPDC051776]
MRHDGSRRVRANYRQNDGRSAQIERHHDPGDLFGLNHDVAP